MSKIKRNFTLPGEAGYEKLTLELAERWGADVIRDSDGTALSKEILGAGYKIYSTICPIREHNEWLKQNLHARQQTFLCTAPATAVGNELTINLMDGFFDRQFSVNDSENAMKYWQVYDRTADIPVPDENWQYKDGAVTIRATPYKQYTVSFLAWRDWEEISMYNHTTNNWDKEPLMQLNPYSAGAMDYLKEWFVKWCENNPHSDVVRFTSLFYNFAWIWGCDPRNRHLFTDWASYDFTVCPEALDDFLTANGYPLTAEVFVRQGKYNATHRVPSEKKRAWMDFIGKFVRRAAKELVDIIHSAGKKAYVFYDDSWVGMEPYSGHFADMGFDGLIKCVFSGYEARLCADVDVPVKEIRFHPYLFPVGLGGAPTFSPGGQPGADALDYWVKVRRALLRKKIDRSGLGGYLHLVEDYPDFVEAMDKILAEFDEINALHKTGPPEVFKPKIGILHAWGALRTWTLSGHFHETDRHMLIHVLEALSGMAFDVGFLSFEDVKAGKHKNYDIIINAGEAGSAWSGWYNWGDDGIVALLTEWTHKGGVFVGIGEPSAIEGFSSYLRMAHVLGADIDNGERACHGRWVFDEEKFAGIPENYRPRFRDDVFLTDGKAQVLAAEGSSPLVVRNSFGKGCGLYISGFALNPGAEKFLQNLLLDTSLGDFAADGATDNPYVECAVFPEKIVFINNSDFPQKASVKYAGNTYTAVLRSYEMTQVRKENTK